MKASEISFARHGGQFGQSWLFSLLLTVLLLGSLAATFGAWRLALQNERVEQQSDLSTTLADVQRDIHSKLDQYFALLRAASVSLGYHGEPDVESWEDFVEAIAPEINYPAIESLEYLKRLPSDQQEAFEAEVRDRMYPDFRIISESESDMMCIILHSALTEGASMGYDACQSTSTRRALDESLHLGQPVISDILRFVSSDPPDGPDSTDSGVPGFVIVMPLGGDRGMSAMDTKGWFAATLTVSDLFETVSERLKKESQSIRIWQDRDGEELVLFEMGDYGDDGQMLAMSEQLTFSDQIWNVEVGQAFQPDRFPGLVLFTGLALSFLFVALVKNSFQIRSRAEALADRMTDAWRQSEQAREQTEEVSLIMVTQVGVDGRWRKVTPRLCALVGCGEEDLLDQPVKDVLKPQDQWGFQAMLDELLAGRQHSAKQELRFQGSADSTVWGEVTASVVRDGKGEPDYLLVFVQDIGDRKQWESELKERDELLQGVADSLNALIAPGDFDASVNEALRILGEAANVDRAYVFTNHPHSLTGLPAQSMRYEWVREGISSEIDNPEMQDLLYSDIAEDWYDRLNQGRPVVAIPRNMYGPGREIFVDQRIQSLLLVPIMRMGGFQGFIGFDDCHQERNWPESEVASLMAAAASVGNAFARRDVEEDLEHSRLLLSSITDNISEGIYRSTPEGTLEYVNSALADMFAYQSPEEMIQVPAPIHYVSPVRRRELQQKMDEQGFYRNEEVEFLRRDGSRFIGMNNAVATYSESGEVLYLDGVISDITQRKEAERKIHYLAHYDTLTGLPNRTLLRDRMEQALAQARRDKSLVAVLFIDLDRFKNVNDSLGHAVGDRLLSEVSRRLQRETRANDTVSRQGGDEFIVLLKDVVESNEAAQVSAKLLAALGEPYRVGNHELHVTPSIGISLYPNDAEEIDELIRNADAAMYQAKDRGRFNFQFFTHDLSVQAWERLSLENQLRRAIQRKEFLLYYQPQLCVETGKIIGMEALVRWRHEGRLISPGVFIPVAEQSGMIIDIGDWVLNEACRQAREWQDEGLPAIPISVNLSAVQFRRRDIRGHIQQALASSGLAPEYLMLELTESTVMDEVDESVHMLGQLHRLGVLLSIDDFGTGYSSLSYLKRFPIDKLKIDKSFVSDIPADSDDMAITAAVIDMGHNLNLTVVAEGVETREQLEFLKGRRCQEMQGFLFSRPVPADEMAELLKNDVRLDLTS